MRKTSSRKNRDLLSSGDAVHAIDSRNARLDHLFWIDTTLRVDGLALRLQEGQIEGHKYENGKHSC